MPHLQGCFMDLRHPIFFCVAAVQYLQCNIDISLLRH